MMGALSPAEMEALLQQETTGRIGCAANGRAYVVPLTYAFHDGTFYLHTGEGQKVQMMRENPNVCFEVDHMESLTQWKSVIAQGRYEELHREEAAKAMTYLYDRLVPKTEGARPSIPGLTPELERAVADGRRGIVFRIRVTEMTGRFETHATS